MRELFGVLMLIFQAGLIVPLAVELYRSKNGKGVSLLGETLWVVAGLGWIAYGALSGSLVLVASGALAFLGSAIVIFFTRASKTPSEMNLALAISALVGVLFLVSTLLWGVTGISVALSVFGVVQFLPQAITSGRGIRDGGVSGVPLIGSLSRSAYTLSWAVYAGAWFLWGIAFSEIDYPLLTWGVAGFIVFGIQFLSGVLYRRNRPSDILTA